ncbi:MAG: hypothetical protein HRU20_13665 [Pseudomonadales bacterium]|nr:hypothetical protein [Pseudomonadales bacterium]
MAKLANAYMAFGLKYENGDQFYKYQGWYGGYGDERDRQFSAEVDVPGKPDIKGEFGAGFQMYQTLHAFEFGHKIFEKGGFRLFGTLGIRDYDMQVTGYGWLDADIDGEFPM